MNYFTKESLHSKLKQKVKLIDLEADDDSSATVMEYGGRLLGLFPENTYINLLWVNPNILDAISSRSRVLGGDRYWISPEREYFYKKPKIWDEWYCQKGLDPANYEILSSNHNSCTLSTPISLINHLNHQELRGEITRQFRTIKEPIKTNISNYCGVEIIDDCVIFRPNVKANGWSLACVISGGVTNPGTVLIPTKQKVKPISYFKTIPRSRVNALMDHISFKIDVDDIFKVAVRPEDLDFTRESKIAYVLKLPETEEYGILIKLSYDIPPTQEDCFDIARDHPNGEIGVIQSYNSNSPNKPLLNYGEIEMHFNKFETIANTSHCKARHKLCGYISTKDDILGVIEKYLDIKKPFLY